MLCQLPLSEQACKICTAFGEDTVSECAAQKWFRKFMSGDETLENAPHEGWPAVINGDELTAATEPDSSQTCQELLERFNVSNETICICVEWERCTN
jgi:hypothetical protein